MNHCLNLIMKILLLSGLVCIIPSCNDSSRTNKSGVTQPHSATDNGHSAEKELARQTVIGFLGWYRDHLQEVNRIPLVNQREGEPYSVNLKNAEQYLTLLKSSQGLTDAYLDEKRKYFKERQEDFRQRPQDEGPPIGFDIDLVTLNQDVDMQLGSLESLKTGDVSIIDDEALVRFKLLDDYEIRLVRLDGRWLINKILNRSRK